MAKRQQFRETPFEQSVPITVAPAIRMSGQEAWVDTMIGVNGIVNGFLDKTAAAEGQRAGALAGGKVDEKGELTFRSMPEHTIRGRAFNTAGEVGYKAALESGVRTKARELFEANKHDPKAYTEAIDSYYKGIRGGIQQNNPEFIGIADTIFDNVKRPYVEESLKFADTRLKEQSMASLNSNISARITDTQNDIRRSDDVESAMARGAQTRAMLVSDLMQNAPKAALNRDVFPELTDAEFDALKAGEDSDSRTGLLSVNQIKETIASYDLATAETVALRGLDDALLAGQGKEFAAHFIKSDIPGLDSADKERVNKSVLSHLKRIIILNADEMRRHEAQAAQQQAFKASELELATRRGQGNREAIDAAFNDGTITGANRTKLHLLMDEAEKKKAEEFDSVDLVSGALLAGEPLDWKDKNHQKAVETFYDKAFAGADPFSDEVMSSVVSIASTTTIIPNQVTALIRSNARSQDPAKAMKAVEYVSRLRESAGQSLEVIPENEKAFSMMVSESVRGGMDDLQAVEQAQKFVYGTPENERKELETIINNKSFRTDSITHLEDFIDDVWDTPFETQPEPPAGMLADYNTLVKSYYTRTRDVDRARKLATDDLKNEWGVSRVNGELQLMRRPPELMYGDGKKTPWMDEQLADIKFSLGIPEESRIIAVSDDNTARGKKPTYALWQVDEDGNETIIITPKGPARWVPDRTATKQFVDQMKGAKNSLDKAKLDRLRVEATRERKRGIVPPSVMRGDDPMVKDLIFEDIIKSGKSTLSPEQEARQRKILEGLV